MSNIDWRAKIEALLVKSQANGVTEEEAETLREKAAYLAAKYSIEDAQARYKDKNHARAKSVEFKMFPPYATRKCDLILSIANVLGGLVVRNSRLANGTVWVYGFEDDLERIKVLYHSLLAQMHIEHMSIKLPVGVNGKSYRNSWMMGFISGVKESLVRAYTKAMRETSGTEIVLRKSREEVELAMRAQFPDLGVRRHTAEVSDSGAYDEGRATGARADIGQGRLSSTDKPALK